MNIEDFTLQRHDHGYHEFLIFAEGPPKTKQKRLSVKTRLIIPQMFATRDEEDCLVILLKQYLGKRPGWRNDERRSVLPQCHRQAGFKRFLQERYKHNHEKCERELTAEESVSRSSRSLFKLG